MERQRIETSKGIVKSGRVNEFGEPEGQLRIWQKGKDFPGLAMSRSIGDGVAHKIGVIAEPSKMRKHNFVLDIFTYKMNRTDYKYRIVTASDGLWDMMSNSEVK